MGRKTISIDESTYEQLTAAKRDGETWDGYFTRLLESQSDDDLERLFNLVDRIPDRTAERTAAEIERRMR